MMNQALRLLGCLLLLCPVNGFGACPVTTGIAIDQPESNKVPCTSQLPTRQNSIEHRRTLTEVEIEKAIRDALGDAGKNSQIRVLDFDRSSMPQGTTRFPLSGANLSEAVEPRRPFIWRGLVSGVLGNDAPCWARVQVLVTRKVVRTTTRLLAGTVLSMNSLEAVEAEASPLLTPKDEDISDYSGLLLKRSMPSMSILNKEVVQQAPLVRRGETVRVTAVAGSTRIVLEGEAHSDGRMGQGIQVSNAKTGRTFLATVNGAGSVLVDLTHTVNR
jgi:flagella basal body P-ring formation protein FlgA